MTADNSNEINAPGEEQSPRKGRTGKAAAKRGSGARRGPSAASRAGSKAEKKAPRRGRANSAGGGGSRTSASRSGGAGSSRGSGIGARLLAGAGRAIPLASGGERIVQRLVDERPYMLGALGLGIGAMIGLMLPGTLSSMAGLTRSRGRGQR